MSFEDTCGIQKATQLIGSKWTLLIIHQLCTRPRGFNELLHAVDGINPRALSLRLKDLVEHKLLKKTVVPTSPPQVEYSLTPQGIALKGIIADLGEWAESIAKK